MMNKPEVFYATNLYSSAPVACLMCRTGEKAEPVIRLTDHEAARAADKARIAELVEELAYALADFDAWASHENNHPHEHLVAWSERARVALAKSRGEV